MDAIKGGPRRHTRRTVLWALFGTVGLLLGAAWATGFATSQSTTNTASDPSATDVFGVGATAPATPSQYAGKIAKITDLAVGFDGLWGTVPADTTLFKVDLTGNDSNGEAMAGKFYTDVYMTNFTSANPWSAQQYKFLEIDCSAADPVAADYDTAQALAPTTVAGDHQPKVMNVTSVDAHVSFQDLDAGSKYCFAIHSTPQANDTAGTFLTRPDTASNPQAPLFTGIVNRAS